MAGEAGRPRQLRLYSRAVSLHSLAPPPSPDPPAPPADDSESSESVALRVPVDIRSVSLFVLATVACVFMLKHMDDVLVPIVLGALIFYALAPAVDWMVRHHVPRVIAAIAHDARADRRTRRRGLRPVGRSDGRRPGHAADGREAAAVDSRFPAAEQRFASRRCRRPRTRSNRRPPKRWAATQRRAA